MTLKVNVIPEVEAKLREMARAEGVEMEDVAAFVLAQGVLSEEEMDAIEDAHDLAQAHRILAETPLEDFVPMEEVWARIEAEREAKRPVEPQAKAA